MDIIDDPDFGEGPFFTPKDLPTPELQPLIVSHYDEWVTWAVLGRTVLDRFNNEKDMVPAIHDGQIVLSISLLPVSEEERNGYH